MRKSTDPTNQRRPQPYMLVTALLISAIGQTAAIAQQSTVAPPGAFSGESAWTDGAYLNVRVSCANPYPHLRVFIDVDNNPATGYSVNGIGADYMIEDQVLHHSQQNSSVWKWDRGNANVLQSRSGSSLVMSVPLESIGSPDSAQVAFEGADDNGNTVDDPTIITSISGQPNGGQPVASAQPAPPPPSGQPGNTLPAGVARDYATGLAWDDGVNFHFRLVCPFAYPHMHVFIDADNDPTTGYVINGIGADFMIEDNELYRYSKSPSGEMAWISGQPIVVRTTPGPNTYDFSVSLASIGSPPVAKVVFQGIDFGGNAIKNTNVDMFVKGSASLASTGGTKPGSFDPTAPSLVDDSQDGWIWSGMVEVDDNDCKGGSEHAGEAMSSAAYTFNGSGVDIYATTGPSVQVEGRTHKLGRMKISIDGKPSGEYSLYQTSTTHQTKVYSVTGLSAGLHVLQLDAESGWIDVDYLEVSFNEQQDAQRGTP